MKNAEIMKIIVSIIAIILLAVIIVNANNLIMPKAQNTVEEAAAPSVQATDDGDCFKDSGTVVFVHSNSCPHCRDMMPIVQELEGEGYKFYWAESSNAEAREMVSNCFSNLLSGYVPQFICPATGKEKTGGMSKQELKQFAESCVA